MTHDKKPGMVFWATAVVVVGLAAYPLSFGPVCLLWQRVDPPAAMTAALRRLYEPLVWGCGQSAVTANAIEGYITFWTGRPAYLYSRQ